MTTEIKQSDVIKLILQYCNENGLSETFKILQRESNIGLNTVENIEAFSSNIKNGKWDLVLKTVSNIKMPSIKLMDLYEQIIIELLEISEKETALLLKDSLIVNNLRNEFPERCLRLEILCKRPVFDYKEAYPYNMTKEKMRKILLEKLVEEIQTVPPSRLLFLLGESLKYQELQGTVKPSLSFDIFTGKIPAVEDEFEKFPNYIEKSIQLGEISKIEIFKFAQNGNFSVIGSVDGIIEVWNSIDGKLKQELAYQAEENFMVHAQGVISLNIGKENELLASGDKEGTVKVWRIATGKCLKKFENTHANKPITCLIFGKDISHLIVASIEIKVFKKNKKKFNT